MPETWLAKQRGKLLNHSHYNLLLDEPVNVLKPNGAPLLLLRKGALPLDLANYARPSLRMAGTKLSGNRGFVTGVMGYLNGEETAFTRDHPDHFRRCLPFIRACNWEYRRELRSQYDLQQQYAERTRLIIPGTVFTTGTMNRWDASHDGRSHAHIDDNDVGFSVLTVLTRGEYSGGYLCFPKWCVAVDVRTTDLLIFDPHELHGNVPIQGEPGWERISAIFYFRGPG